ncbi:MAG: hypothetical protein US15_C0006G0009 [Candidatus Moranbacteria bacterium GW2011_GWF1_36_4]|nr:MAG: hypothetical protein US15_C0006G0009 [Candidatus Moranbacteria bacterium GW2011_GWF1_36_4]
MKKVFAFSLSALVFVFIFFVAYNISFRSPMEKDDVAVIEDENSKIKKFFQSGMKKCFFLKLIKIMKN